MAEAKAAPKAEPGTAVIDYKAELAKLAVATAEAEKPSGNWISFKNGILSYASQPIPGNKLKVVVIHSVFENQFYQDRYDPNNQQPPICYAFGETDEDLKPHADAAKPQAESCASCSKNQWGSDPGGGKGKACKNVRRLAMVAASDLDDVSKAEIAIAKLPVTSVKNWSTFASQIANVLKLPPIAVIAEMSVTPDAKTQFQVDFALMDKIEDGAVIQALLARRRDTTALVYAPYDKPVEKVEQPRKF
jgi:hypothetical protein